MKNHHTVLQTTLMTLALLAPFGLFAEQARDMEPDGRLSLEAQAGDFVLVGHDQNRLMVINPDGHAVQPAIGGDASHWSIRFAGPQADDKAGNPDPIEIRLPGNAEVEARLGQGSLSARGLNGPLVQLQVIGGSVRVHDSRPDRLFVETVDASQHLDGLAVEETRLQSVGGEINARGEGKRLSLQTLSGPVRLDIDGLLDLELQSLSGDSRIRVRPTERAVLRARSQSAALAFELPDDTPLEIKAESHRGSIDSAFGGSVEKGVNGNRRLHHGAGPGKVRLEARSVEGPINVSKLAPQAPQAQMLVFWDADSPRQTGIVWGGGDENPGEIMIGIDDVERVALRPGQFSVLELPLDSRQVFAESPGFRRIELDVVELVPAVYCFRLEGFRRSGGGDRFGVVQWGFRFSSVDCPEPAFFDGLEPVDAFVSQAASGALF